MIPRPLPAFEPATAFFWSSGADGHLRIQRCGDCGRYQHPPLPRCPACRSEHVAPAIVSGRGRIATCTVNRHAWLPGLDVPFVFAAVELNEQAELYVLTNIIDCQPDGVCSGMPVEVVFEAQDDVFLPLFRPIGL